MRSFDVVVEQDPSTRLYVGYVPGWPGAHSQAESLDELQANLREVIEMLLEDGDPHFDSEFIGVQRVRVA
ncbi:MAG: type II toxin-antitoxin system HicB family antitoxin [Desulfomonile tiedjei]|jgi:predicted RNase H-like HicB family nuclease|nr:type II toxin-antitoxin system HicB family antitoxin [Desulfomonile tiedjei]